jgi:ParB family transcriptional regulator, chromosome partitioning protein
MNEKVPDVQMIPIAQINVLNPRSRNKLVFQGIVSNISNIGLKRPITVALRSHPIDGNAYDLVCGEGRLNAYIALGQTEIPAIVNNATREECFLMSLVENVARRMQSPVELLREITTLKTRGYNTTEIAKKIDLARSYVAGICHLLENGEERLLAAVEKGRVPVSVAMQISDADEAGIQQALCDAYEDKTLRGRKLLAVRRLIEQRKTNGKRRKPSAHKKTDGLPSAESLVSVYRQEADRQKFFVKKARLTENHLIFVVSALKKLFQDENFLTLLRAEGLETLPEYLALRIQIGEKG